MKQLILLILIACCWKASNAQTQYKDGRILILLDGSKNMLSPMSNNGTKFKAAEKIILNFMDSVYRINDEVEFALHVYGHQYPPIQNNCYDNKLEVAFSKNNLAQMDLRLASLKPQGMESMKSAIQIAIANDFTAQNLYNYTFIVITSGEDNCEEGICTLSQAIQDKNLKCSPTIVNLSEREVQYGCIGEKLAVKNEGDIPGTISHLLSKYRSLIAPKDKNYKSAYGTTGQKAHPIQVIQSLKKYEIELIQPHPVKLSPINIYKPFISNITVPTMTSKNEIGYLRITENMTGGDFTLYYLQGRSYVSVKKTETQLSIGQQAELKTGNYKLLYKIPTQSGTLKKVKFILIKNKMITEIKLN